MPLLDERAAVRRLFDRLGLGARRGDVDGGVAAGFDATLDRLLTEAPTPPADAPPLPLLPSVAADDPRRPGIETQRSDQQRELKLWWLDRMSSVEGPVQEKLTWFWHGHFATSEDKVPDPGLMLAQNRTLRARGMGSFRDLAAAMVVDPALVDWLDGQLNRKGAPNENLGRELLELFTLGVGHYSETDVRESARALTGWTLKDRDLSFAPAKHDPAPKSVLGSIAPYDAGSLVELVVARPDSARFVAGRLWARLVSATPPDDAQMGRLVAAYGPGTSTTALLRALATAPAFHDSSSALVKQPVEWAVGLARAADQPIGALPDAQQRSLLAHLAKLGQVPFKPPNVGGWPAGAPYLTPSATIHRLSVARIVLATAPLPDAPRGTNARLEWARSVLAIDSWSARSRAALTGLADGDVRQLLIAAAVSPEYVVSG